MITQLQLNSPQDYTINVYPDCSYQLFARAQATLFTTPASKPDIGKLYTVSLREKLIYVGITKQPMATRLNYGFKANGAGGYHGYKWRHLDQALNFSVWTAMIEDEYASLREMETIEAEVAFLCRAQSGQWPEHQHEIHFYASQQTHRLAAEKIYAHAITTPQQR